MTSLGEFSKQDTRVKSSYLADVLKHELSYGRFRERIPLGWKDQADVDASFLPDPGVLARHQKLSVRFGDSGEHQEGKGVRETADLSGSDVRLVGGERDRVQALTMSTNSIGKSLKG